ncbi:linear amide C-N hydrolase [Leptolyngbya sp. NIES-2104]|uniref:linear amide C-N hydrolase n=1 Tax=Leptolyngbya sp. NIES-2104 TaxID=1552121 RepID=UPI0006EC77F2|nr:linear amide C-N hydrolase [Leptolyngbya sp. NIES-2104]GAP96476.1 choloylglycine hydrolase [Leptolyngbya sp. NIES-2104]
MYPDLCNTIGSFLLQFVSSFQERLSFSIEDFTGLLSIPIMIGCTRAIYRGLDDLVITGRTMDWLNDMKSNLWAFPRGIERDGAAGENSIRWVSKHGSVGVSGWDVGIADGMNEQGLFANLLYLPETQYPIAPVSETCQPLSLSLWAQYVLDNFATVSEAVSAIEQESFYVVPVTSPDGKPGTIHLSISDPTGDSAIFEYVEGKLTIHHSPDYRVMTNSPTYSKQLALNEYWQSIGGTTMLPGTNRAADRFVRASFYINVIPKTANAIEGVAAVFSVIRNASVPMGISTPSQPNISSTIWRTVADHTNKRFFFESVRSPNVFWVNLDNLDFTEGSPVKKLTLTDGAIFAGDTSAQFQPTEPMRFLKA